MSAGMRTHKMEMQEALKVKMISERDRAVKERQIGEDKRKDYSKLRKDGLIQPHRLKSKEMGKSPRSKRKNVVHSIPQPVKPY
jgi:hypothetical protein